MGRPMPVFPHTHLTLQNNPEKRGRDQGLFARMRPRLLPARDSKLGPWEPFFLSPPHPTPRHTTHSPGLLSLSPSLSSAPPGFLPHLPRLRTCTPLFPSSPFSLLHLLSQLPFTHTHTHNPTPAPHPRSAPWAPPTQPQEGHRAKLSAERAFLFLWNMNRVLRCSLPEGAQEEDCTWKSPLGRSGHDAHPYLSTTTAADAPAGALPGHSAGRRRTPLWPSPWRNGAQRDASAHCRIPRPMAPGPLQSRPFRLYPGRQPLMAQVLWTPPPCLLGILNGAPAPWLLLGTAHAVEAAWGEKQCKRHREHSFSL